MFLNNRHYDPTIGVFICVDPLVTLTGEPYIYGSANPITISDPSGLCGCENFDLLPGASGQGGAYSSDHDQAAIERANETSNARWNPQKKPCQAWCTREQFIESAEATAGLFPVAGEVVDTKNCVTGDGWSCAAVIALILERME